MKNLIKNSLVLVVLFTTLLGNANEISSLRKLKDEKTTLLTLENVKQGHQLIIKDKFGVILYKENIEKSGKYTKGFDLTSLPNGDYFFELDKDLEIKVIPFKVNSNVVKFDKEREESIFKPYVKTNLNKLYISKLSLNKESLKIRVFYESSNTNSFNKPIYSESIENTKNIQRVLILDKTMQGKYKIVSESEGRTFINFVQI